MSRSSLSRLKSWLTVVVVGFTLFSLAACNGPTFVDNPEGVGDYAVAVSMSPETLNVPQVSTLTYAVTDKRNGKPLNQIEDTGTNHFAPIFGALFHEVLISHDLQHFRHSFANSVVLNAVSVQTYFAAKGKYDSYAIFQPQGGDVYVYAHTIQIGSDPGSSPALVPDANQTKVARQYGLRLYLLTGPTTLRAGQDAQIAVYVTERGIPVSGLWPYLDAPGYLWIVNQEGKNFTWEPGVSPAHLKSGADEPSTPLPVPTLIPNLDDLLATRTVLPAPTLAPVQATAQASILEPQPVQPDVTYGPYVVFNHRFEAPGLYKLWFEIQYRGQPIESDWVVQVQP